MPGKRKKPPPRRLAASAIRVRPTGGTGYELVFPASVRQRAEDMEEVRSMLAAGEIEIAVDELRWLLEGCRHLLEAHKLLGDIAFAAGDFELARAHFGSAFQLGADAMAGRPPDATLPHARPANRAFHEAGKGLVESLLKLRRLETAQRVARQLCALDPADPLGVQQSLKAGGCR